MTTRVLLGVDVGSSNVKVLATTEAGAEITAVSAPTRWARVGDGRSELSPDGLRRTAIGLLTGAMGAAAKRVGAVTVSGIGITGMAEAGVLLDAHDQVQYPIIAWFDPRGAAEFATAPRDLLAQFPARTGLPVSPLATIAKLLWLRAQGQSLAGCRWLNVPEFLAHALGGRVAAELSLASRTGLLDQDTLQPWRDAVAAVGGTEELVPPLVLAGTPLGTATVAPFRGAVITVAGHDHPAAAVGCGALGPDELFDSFGTAEAFVQSVRMVPAADARARLASVGINAVHHVLGGRRLLLVGTKSGLIMRRTLALLGATTADRRAEVDRAACERLRRTDPVSGVRVTGAANDDGTLRITVTEDGTDPGELWLATLDHAADEADRVLAAMAAEVGQPSSTVVAGGWTRMESVRQVKRRRLPGTRFSGRAQAGAFGAALFAGHALRAARAPVGTALKVPRDLSTEGGLDLAYATSFIRAEAFGSP